MTDPAAPAAKTPAVDERAIRERVRDLTAQMLTSGRLDTDGVKEVVRAMGVGTAFAPALDGEQARAAFAESMRGLGEALQRSAQAAHESLMALAARGAEFSDNDLKLAFASLQKMQEDYVVVANRVADATTGNIRRELADLALHAQRVGADAGVRMAQVMSEFANRMSGSTRGRAASGLEAAREAGANMTLLTSGLLAGFADALRQQSEAKKTK
jgi:phosphoribosyl-ATP pyrophosphohydrolase